MQGAKAKIFPSYFNKKYESINRFSIPERAAEIRRHEKKIKAKNHKPVSNILELVIASNYHVRVARAAREVFSHIAALEEGRCSFEEYKFSQYMQRSLFLGALFELLPRETSVRLYDAEFLSYYEDMPRALKGGQILLRFSTSHSAARFVADLLQRSPMETNRILSAASNWDVIKIYPFRRYEVSDIFKRLGSLIFS
jgi:hypothetical protein